MVPKSIPIWCSPDDTGCWWMLVDFNGCWWMLFDGFQGPQHTHKLSRRRGRHSSGRGYSSAFPLGSKGAFSFTIRCNTPQKGICPPGLGFLGRYTMWPVTHHVS